jgi:hypothetical protein
LKIRPNIVFSIKPEAGIDRVGTSPSIESLYVKGLLVEIDRTENICTAYNYVIDGFLWRGHGRKEGRMSYKVNQEVNSVTAEKKTIYEINADG